VIYPIPYSTIRANFKESVLIRVERLENNLSLRSI
jgi:hypothetical protein